jgi:RHS repeat-associated protein
VLATLLEPERLYVSERWLLAHRDRGLAVLRPHALERAARGRGLLVSARLDRLMATYDAADRIATRGALTYAHDADGFATARGTTALAYAARGELLAAGAVQYTYDGLGRRVARIDAGGTTQYYYGALDDDLRVTALRDPSGNLVELVYDDAGHLQRMRGTTTYYVATDAAGAPRVVFDATGAIVKRIDRDAFGALLADSNPALVVPLGFDGGIDDPVTGLVRIGVRDYDPDAGQFLAADPYGFATGQLNLYAYASNDPVGKRDVGGAGSVKVSLCAGGCIALKLAYKDGKFGMCSEVGGGVGSSVEVDPSAAPDPVHMYLKAELKAKLGLASIGYEGKICEDGSRTGNPFVDLGPLRIRPHGVTGKESLDVNPADTVVNPETGELEANPLSKVIKPKNPFGLGWGVEGKAVWGSCL